MKPIEVPDTQNDGLELRPTFGEHFPDLHFEAVTGRDSTLELHAYDGTRAWTSRRVEYGGKSFAPTLLAEGLPQAVRFPTSSAGFGSAIELTESMRNFICESTHTTLEDAALLAAFAISTWFADCFPRSPCLHLTGSNTGAISVMRLLTTLCWRPLLVGRLDLRALATLPTGLNPTLLVVDANLPPSVMRILEASRNRELAIPVGKSYIHAYGARVLFSDSISVKASDLRIHVSSTTGVPQLKTYVEQHAASYQAKLLRYRFVHFNAVRNSFSGTSQNTSVLPLEIQPILFSLIDCQDFRDSVSARLHSQHREVCGARFTETDCLVVEAALCYCHDPEQKEFLVKQITDAVNALLVGRQEDRAVSPKSVGHVLRGLGLYAERVATGYRVVLSNNVRTRIHLLAREYNVASLGKREFDCDQCDVANSNELRELTELNQRSSRSEHV